MHLKMTRPTLPPGIAKRYSTARQPRLQAAHLVLRLSQEEWEAVDPLLLARGPLQQQVVEWLVGLPESSGSSYRQSDEMFVAYKTVNMHWSSRKSVDQLNKYPGIGSDVPQRT